MATATAKPPFLVVIGASAGGISAMIELSRHLTAEVNAAVLFVIHMTAGTKRSVALPERLQRSSPFTWKYAEDGEELRSRHVYLSVAGKHLLVDGNRLKLGEGPAENRWKPSIDATLRSAAASYDGHCIGMVLTGLLYDGVAGMMAVKRCGGVCIVQNPEEAEFPDMPLAVIREMEADHIVTLKEIVPLLENITNSEREKVKIPADVKLEAEIADNMATGVELVEQLGPRSPFSCPDCGGGLWEMREGKMPVSGSQLRCHVGHTFTEAALLARMREGLEATFWMALRMMEERRTLLLKMSADDTQKGWHLLSENKKERANELVVHIDRLKKLLFEATQN